MGAPMATRLLRANYPVFAWNRSPHKAQALAAFGAHVCVTPAEAAGSAQIVITMLEAGPVVADVITRATPGFRPGTLVIDMSSTCPSEAQELHAKLAADGIAFLDAPVSGGVAGAEAGTLAIMAGGQPADFVCAEPILRVLGHPTLVGPVGCGQLAKLCNQLIVGGTLAIVAEALLLAQAGGADPHAVRAAIRGGFAESRILDVHGARMLERNFLPGGQVKSQVKDLENTLATAAAAGVRLPVVELVTQIYRSIAPTLPNADQSAVLIALERLNPEVRLGADTDHLPD
jgi:2-hydroxy-3-oxopropionate reductase